MLEADEKGKIQFTVNRIKSKTDRAVFLSQLDIKEPYNKLEKPWKISEPSSYVEKSSPGDRKNDSAKGTSNQDNQTDDSSNGSKGSRHTDNHDADTKYNGKKTSQKTANANPNRGMLIPANVMLTITNKKCSGVFRELKNKLKYDDQPHSIAVMFRVFLELSLQDYLSSQNISLDSRKDGLHDKVVAVTDDLQQKSKISGAQCNAIRATSKDITTRTGALQQYVHNNHMFPDKTSLNTNWDNLESLFIGIWS